MIVTCISCGLRQFVFPSDICRRCRAPLGSSIFELHLVDSRLPRHERNQLSLPFGSAIRSLRLRQGRTEVQLARSADVDRSHLSRIERNLLTPNLDTVLRILRGLGAESIFIHIPGSRRNS
jgi:DNA-binding XRE family transcriptional regulator